MRRRRSVRAPIAARPARAKAHPARAAARPARAEARPARAEARPARAATTDPPGDDTGTAALLSAARAARARAYAPYSRYRVGAAVLTKSGRIFVGCNVENATYGATVCAERSAIAAMVAAGEREPVACVVVTAGPTPAAPCGICRQVLSEFAVDMPITLLAEDAAGRPMGRADERLASLLPKAFHIRKAKRGRG